VSIIDNNVYAEPDLSLPGYGWGFGVSGNVDFNLGTFVISNNIFTSKPSQRGGTAMEFAGGEQGGTLSNNIIYNWASPTDATGGAVTYTGYNVYDANGANNLGAPEPFLDPNRTVGSYYDTVVGSPGHTADDFLAAARKQSKDNWDPALTADAVNNYIRAGFGK
jgi:hypothetical protein